MSVFGELHTKILKSFEKNKVEYLLIGGHAAIFYGVRRTTSDIDLFVNPTVTNGHKVISAFKDIKLDTGDLIPEDFEKEIYLSFGSYNDGVDILNFTPGVTFEEAYKNKKLFDTGELQLNIIHYLDLIKNKENLNREGNKSFIDKYDVSELRKIFKIKD
ncbi:MAG: hypothetical protein SFY32_09960 [Bacteroidota bacterium]|nr:hypothetical protein [Bacteroidota bacterium]